MAQLVERVLGKDEVSSSNLDSSSIEKRTYLVVGSFFRFKQFMDSNCSFLLCKNE